MSLIACPECGKSISDRASACPRCGCPIEKVVVEETQKESTKIVRKGSNPVLLVLFLLVTIQSLIVIVYTAIDGPRIETTTQIFFDILCGYASLSAYYLYKGLKKGYWNLLTATILITLMSAIKSISFPLSLSFAIQFVIVHFVLRKVRSDGRIWDKLDESVKSPQSLDTENLAVASIFKYADRPKIDGGIRAFRCTHCGEAIVVAARIEESTEIGCRHCGSYLKIPTECFEAYQTELEQYLRATPPR